MRHPFWGRKGRQPGALISCGRLQHTLIKFKVLALFFYIFFYNSTNGTANWISLQLMSYSFLPCRSTHERTTRWYELTLNINITLTSTRLPVAHTLAAWIFKSTEIKMQIISNLTAHNSLNHLENAAVGSFQCTTASLYLSFPAEFWPALCAIAHTYGF